MIPHLAERELFQHLLVSVAEEMGIVLRKTAHSANIKERRDFSCAVYDAQGQTVAMGEYIPVHLGAMPLAVAAVRKELELGPGDVAIVNDPFRGGTHLPDITAVRGVFLKGGRKPVAWLANRAHHSDVGGMAPGSMPLAAEIYQEGLRIPPVLLQRAGKVQRDVLNLVLANVRTPGEREADLLAQCMSLERGQVRLAALGEKYGWARVARNIEELLRYSERMMRATLQGIPDGAYRFADLLDGDGMRTRDLRIEVCVRIAGEEAEVDFTGTSSQAEGPVNANFAIVLSAVGYVLRCLLPDEAPFTAGLLRPIRINAPEGTVVNARLPASMAAGNVETSQRITDVLLGALAQALPGRIPAASCGSMNNVSLGGWDPVRQRPFTYYETIAGGMGASYPGDGLSARHSHMTNSWNTPIEAFEHQFPLRVTSYRLRRNSGGGGQHRGGEGIVREYEALAAAAVSLLSERRRHAPYGLAGGKPGEKGLNLLIQKGRTAVLPSKASFSLKAGERLRMETPGGGGWGKPLTAGQAAVQTGGGTRPSPRGSQRL